MERCRFSIDRDSCYHMHWILFHVRESSDSPSERRVYNDLVACFLPFELSKIAIFLIWRILRPSDQCICLMLDYDCCTALAYDKMNIISNKTCFHACNDSMRLTCKLDVCVPALLRWLHEYKDCLDWLPALHSQSFVSIDTRENDCVASSYEAMSDLCFHF